MLLRNFRRFAGHHLDAGATRLVLTAVIEEQDERKQLADAVGVDLTVRRPQAELPVIRWRLAGRHGREPATLQRCNGT